MSEEKTLIVLNPHAGSGRAGRIWHEIEPLLWEELGDLVVAVTNHPEEVAEHLDKARDAGLTRVIAIGGDGTNHAIINAIQDLAMEDPQAPKMTFANLPIGTGRDFSRTLGIPFDPKEAVKWIAHAEPQPLDIGHLQIDGSQDLHFLNIASAGISGEIASRVNRITKRRPWTFHLASLKTLFAYKAPRMNVRLDGDLWYNDRAWTVVVANGRMFGHGMLVAPHAEINDGLLDVIVVEDMAPLKAAIALNSVYGGKHIYREDVHYRQAKEIIIESPDGYLQLELDGENKGGNHLNFTIREAALNMLMSA